MSAEIIALSGGVGGAKLVSGLSRVMTAGQLVVAANTGDDFSHFGLHISPDIDSIFYASTDRNNLETGWGRKNETWHFMEVIREFGGDDWFNLGDGDLAMHVLRTHRLAQGLTLTEATEAFCQALDVPFKLLPMSNDPVTTMIETDQGHLAMQDYFVRERCAPTAKSFSYEGAGTAKINEALLSAFSSSALKAIVLCPSNPYLSIDPILALARMTKQIRAAGVPVIAVSPIVGGQALKGPLGKIMGELGVDTSSVSIAKHYKDLIDVLIIDEGDIHEKEAIEALGIRVQVMPTVMKTVDDQIALSAQILEIVSP